MAMEQDATTVVRTTRLTPAVDADVRLIARREMRTRSNVILCLLVEAVEQRRRDGRL